VNERLRSARQKLGVSSSREAARILAADELGHEIPVDRQFGVSSQAESPQRPHNVLGWIGVIMAVAIATTFGLMAILGSHAAPTRAPAVVRTVPASGAVIPPGPFTLSVTFDQAMSDGSFSFVQKAAESFPRCAFPAQLSSDKRTFTVRCTAEPRRDYEIWFNSPPYMNFKGANGVPSEPYQLLFRSSAR
jgi:hypothetical protein